MKKILDVCCGTKAFWYNKQDERVLFQDVRSGKCEIKPDKGHPHRTLLVDPDVVGDFTKMVFPDETFYIVVFDPPHANFGQSSVMAKTYGSLRGYDWRELLRGGFAECFRVLKPNGTLVFKWNEWEIPLRKILELTPAKPLFGHISGKRANTHWVCFIKDEKRAKKDE